MKQKGLDFNNLKTAIETDFINLDEILDPYDRMKGDYYITEIIKAEHFKHDNIGNQFISLEFSVLEQIGNLDDKSKYKFRGKKLFLNLSLHPKRIWLLKNLCNALHISGKHKPEDLTKLFIGRIVSARVIPQYDYDFDTYFHTINKFQSAR